jgi:TRAP-type C4-dicarboxylate transport system substrate-binding protein
LEERKLKETVDYAVFPVQPLACVGAVVFNLQYWNRLPEDVQQIIEEAGREADRETRGQLPELDVIYRKKIEEEGKVQFIDLTPAQQKPWLDLWLEYGMLGVKDLGPDAIEMWNECQDFKKELGIEPFPKIE